MLTSWDILGFRTRLLATSSTSWWFTLRQLVVFLHTISRKICKSSNWIMKPQVILGLKPQKKMKPRPGTWIFSSLGTYPQLDIFKIKKVSLRESFTWKQSFQNEGLSKVPLLKFSATNTNAWNSFTLAQVSLEKLCSNTWPFLDLPKVGKKKQMVMNELVIYHGRIRQKSQTNQTKMHFHKFPPQVVPEEKVDSQPPLPSLPKKSPHHGTRASLTLTQKGPPGHFWVGMEFSEPKNSTKCPAGCHCFVSRFFFGIQKISYKWSFLQLPVHLYNQW